MTTMEINKLVEDIRAHENAASYARHDNEKTLPKLKSLLSDVEAFQFTEKDSDLKARVQTLALEIQDVSVDDISTEFVEKIRSESADILNEIVTRYQERLNLYANRQGNL